MTSEINREAVRAALDAATPGPWRTSKVNPSRVFGPDSQPVLVKDPSYSQEVRAEANASLIAMAPDLATAYLAIIEENERLRLLLEEAATDITGYVEQDYPEATRAQYPSIENKWRRDMALVWKIREALAAYRATKEQSHE